MPPPFLPLQKWVHEKPWPCMFVQARVCYRQEAAWATQASMEDETTTGPHRFAESAAFGKVSAQNPEASCKASLAVPFWAGWHIYKCSATLPQSFSAKQRDKWRQFSEILAWLSEHMVPWISALSWGINLEISASFFIPSGTSQGLGQLLDPKTRVWNQFLPVDDVNVELPFQTIPLHWTNGWK